MPEAALSANSAVEELLLRDISIDVPWSLIERFSTLVRESGSEDEREAARYVAARLKEFGVPHKVHNPELFLSVPVSSSLEISGKEIRAKSPAFSSSTGSGGITGEVLFVPGKHPKDASKLFNFDAVSNLDVRGKIVLTEGYGFPESVSAYKEKGALGQIYINQGEDIHWGICTTTWGAPDLDSAPRLPKTPVISINRSDGVALKEQARGGTLKATIRTELKEGWFACPLIVAEIEGREEPERFLLVHGHYDSWDIGIGDNAVGNATMLELARIFHQNRDKLSRSVKFAWWPAHSTGRYGGSTWFADTFGLELTRNCIAQIDIDSPGCRWATEYYDVSWMSETEDFCVQAIRDVTGKEAAGERPHQAGDYSFNNIGLSGFFMLLSTMPKALLEEKGYYPVGGCGGNIAWHTENDTLEIADRDNLLRDLRVYTATIQRVLNNPVHPFDFRKLGQEFHATLTRYSEAAAGLFDFSEGFDALAGLQGSLDGFYQQVAESDRRQVADQTVRTLNDTLLELGRILIPINYTRKGRFRNEPAVPIAPLPDLAPAEDLQSADDHDRRIITTHLRRGLNRVVFALEQASKVVDSQVAKIE